MKITIELFNELYGNEKKSFFKIRVDSNGECYQKQELVDDDIFKSMFDRIFDRAKQELEYRIREEKEVK